MLIIYMSLKVVFYTGYKIKIKYKDSFKKCYTPLGGIAFFYYDNKSFKSFDNNFISVSFDL